MLGYPVLRAVLLSRCIACFALVAVLGLAADAAAQARTVAVADLEGRGSGAARRVIVDGLEERGYEIVGDGADARVEGSAASRGQRWRIDLRVLDAAGEEAGRVRMRVRGARGVSRLVARLDSVLEGMAGAGAADASPSGEAVSDSEPAEGTSSEATSPDAPDPVAGAPDAADPEPASAPTPSDAPDGASADADDLPIQVLAQLGAGVRSRAIELLSPDGDAAAYRADAYFEITARAQARFFDVAFVRARFGSSIGLSSEREDPSLGEVDTLFVWIRADAGASVWIDDTVELGAAFGLGWDRYELAFNELVPTAEYVHLRPALVTGYRLVGRLLVLDAELGVRVPLGVGDLEGLYGVDHDTIGVDGVARFRGTIDPGFTWAVEAGFRQYWLEFARGEGAVTGRDHGWHATGYAGWLF